MDSSEEITLCVIPVCSGIFARLIFSLVFIGFLAHSLTALAYDASKSGYRDISPYTITLKNDIRISGSINIDGKGVLLIRADELLTITIDNPTHIRIVDTDFYNIKIKISRFSGEAGNSGSIRGNTFRSGVEDHNGKYLVVAKSSNINIRDNRFFRDESSPGKGAQIWRSQNILIIENVFSNLVKGRRIPGYFNTAINVNGYSSESLPARSKNIQIENNFLNRERYSSRDEDHGIYIWGVDGAVINNNIVKGWSTSLKGGSIKLRNSTNVIIDSNRFFDSGILLNYYQNTHPQEFEYIKVSNNDIFVAGSCVDRKFGISYWNDSDQAVENSIRISDNVVYGGSINISGGADNSLLNNDHGGVFRNIACSFGLPEYVENGENVSTGTE